MTFPAIPDAEVQIILPTYNRRSYFTQAIESVLEQTYRDFHIVVIDDGSTDGTIELAKEYERRLPSRVTVIVKPRHSDIADSITTGIRLTSKARYVAFHNDDDIWQPTKLEKQVAELSQDSRLGLVATEAAIIDAEAEPTGKLFSDLFGKPDDTNPARRIFWRGNCYCTASVVTTRAAIDLVELNYPLPGRCMDMYMWLVISSHMPIAWLEEPLTSYRVAAGQLTQVRSREMWRETYSLREHLLEKDETLRAAVGGAQAGRDRLADNALYLANSYLRERDFGSYGWFAWQVLKRHNVRLTALLAKYTGRALQNRPSDESAGDEVYEDAP